VSAIHQRSHATYGAPRIHAELRAEGIKVGRKRVARLLKKAGLVGASRRKWIHTTVRDRNARPAPDLVQRNFGAPQPNRVWVADITYIPTWTGFLYLAVVLDVFSRKIVGWAMETHLRTELALEALDLALWQRRPDEIIHHSDQAPSTPRSSSARVAAKPECVRRWARSAIASTTRCAKASLPRSNASCSPRRRFKTPAEARMAVFEFIEGWYNPHRPHSALDYLSPINYERSHHLQPLNPNSSPSTEMG
jgi:putative transposase